MWKYIIKLGIIMLAVLPVCLLARRPWREKTARAWVWVGFVVFMAGLLALVLEGEYQSPKAMAESAILRIKSGEGINLVPFRSTAGSDRGMSAFHRPQRGCGRPAAELSGRMSGSGVVFGGEEAGSGGGEAGPVAFRNTGESDIAIAGQMQYNRSDGKSDAYNLEEAHAADTE